MLIGASALALLVGGLMLWPPPRAESRLSRVLDDIRTSGSMTPTRRRWSVPNVGRTPAVRGLHALAAIIALAQLWPWPVALVVVAVLRTAGVGAARGRRERADAREEQAAVEGLGVLVAELRAGRPPDQALASAGQHCGHPKVGADLGLFGRSLQWGDSLGDWAESGPRVAPGVSREAAAARERSDWRAALAAGTSLSQQTGCGLADVVDAVESDLANRGRHRGEVRAAAAGHRATVALLAGLPILGLGMGSGIGAEPVRVLTSTTIGHVLLLTGVGLELVGLAWCRRLTGNAVRGS